MIIYKIVYGNSVYETTWYCPLTAEAAAILKARIGEKCIKNPNGTDNHLTLESVEATEERAY